MLQYKFDKSYTGIEKVCKEYEKILQVFPSHISSEILPQKIKPALCYEFVGSLVTERFDYFYDETIISLDKNYYLGVFDCEIEIEFHDYSKAEQILKILSIDKTKASEMGKYSRFVKKIRE